MKKATMIIIGIIYIASVVLISVFGLKAVVYEERIPVTDIECINETDENSTVKIVGGKKRIEIIYSEPGSIEGGTPTGTIIQLFYRVKPDDATNKEVRFSYNKNLTRATFVKDENTGRETGLILFTGKCLLDVDIISTDGGKVVEQVTIWVK